MDVIFDVDGTIANIEHRRHWVASKPKNWAAFNRGMKNDLPHRDIIWVMKVFYDAGARILIASGRGEEDREVTTSWLVQQNIVPAPAVVVQDIVYEKLYMRAAKDYRSDDIVKREILDIMRADGYNPTMAIDDRDQVVAMWREAGLRCLQVAPGDF